MRLSINTIFGDSRLTLQFMTSWKFRVGLLVVLMFGLSIGGILINRHAFRSITEQECNGTIDGIKVEERLSHFLVRGKWENFFTYGDRIESLAEVGDSISKLVDPTAF